jgi:hypothetical protein
MGGISKLALPFGRIGCYDPAFVSHNDVRMEAPSGMQSSAGTVCRALLMLVFLVGIPAAAVWGTCWPQVVQRLHAKWQEFGLPPIAALTSFASSRANSDAPRFVPPADPARAPVSSVQKSAAALPGKANAPLTPLAPPTSPTLSIPGTAPESLATTQPSHGNVSGSQPAATGQNSDLAAPAQLSRTREDQYTFVQQRLRELGATHYQLESWGNEPPLYRFCCKMAIGGSASYTRYFEATNANPIEAMNRVLDQVETWRSSVSSRADALSTPSATALANQ